jgi:pimeloyl-ACP methyl ester carboxylesterase
MRRLRRLGIAVASILLLLGIVLAAIGAAYEPDVQVPAGVAGRQVQVGGVALRVLQRGSGRDVLLVHGSPGCLEDWAAVIDGLVGEFRVTAYDRPGHGYSGDTGAYSLEHNAEVASALIDQLGLRDVVVAGHSYGGSTALALALRAPAAVDAYVVVDSATYTPSRRADASIAVLAMPGIGRGVAAVLGPRIAAPRVRAGVEGMFGGRTPPPGFVDLRVRLFSTPKVVHALAMETVGAAGWLSAQSPRYPGIAKPVHVIAQHDDAFRRSTAERLHREVPGSTLRLVPGTGHYVQVEKPDEVIAAIRAAASRAQ